ncbi:K+/H+ antiporter subunit F [Novosphingobium sp. YJ-S2-02]|uniref:K+/H+ antiporter subunit F n=1 Tax=Novosphingobium aureum TaxID=2792964 RepID=A0A931HF80_9SPHN|nr:K+/H+ antiporter subunit F [Novosphingobium aureum]
MQERHDDPPPLPASRPLGPALRDVAADGRGSGRRHGADRARAGNRPADVQRCVLARPATRALRPAVCRLRRHRALRHRRRQLPRRAADPVQAQPRLPAALAERAARTALGRGDHGAGRNDQPDAGHRLGRHLDRWVPPARPRARHRRPGGRDRAHQEPLRKASHGDFPVIEIALDIALGCVALAMLLNLWSLLKGPTAPDRILALDTMIINAIALFVLFGVMENTRVFFEAALLMAMVGFVGTVAYTKFLLRGDIVE